MNVGITAQYSKVESPLCKKDLIVSDKMKLLVERVTVESTRETLDKKYKTRRERQTDADIDSIEGIDDLKFVFCQRESCVLGKK